MKRIQDILPSVINKYGLQHQVEASFVLHAFRQSCRNHLGEKADSAVQAKRYDKGIIYVSAKNATWVQQLQLVKDQIMSDLEGTENISRIVDMKISQQTAK